MKNLIINENEKILYEFENIIVTDKRFYSINKETGNTKIIDIDKITSISCNYKRNLSYIMLFLVSIVIAIIGFVIEENYGIYIGISGVILFIASCAKLAFNKAEFNIYCYGNQHNINIQEITEENFNNLIKTIYNVKDSIKSKDNN